VPLNSENCELEPRVTLPSPYPAYRSRQARNGSAQKPQGRFFEMGLSAFQSGSLKARYGLGCEG
jgi:hypothetical protein